MDIAEALRLKRIESYAQSQGVAFLVYRIMAEAMKDAGFGDNSSDLDEYPYIYEALAAELLFLKDS